MNPSRVAILILLFSMPFISRAANKESSWASPNKKIEVYKLKTESRPVKFIDEQYEANEILMIRPGDTEDEGLCLMRGSNMKAIWSPDSRFLLISYESLPHSSDIDVYRISADEKQTSLTASLILHRSVGDQIEEGKWMRWSFVRWELPKNKLILNQSREDHKAHEIEVDLKREPIKIVSYRAQDVVKSYEGTFLGFITGDYVHCVFRMKDGKIHSFDPSHNIVYFLSVNRGKPMTFQCRTYDEYVREGYEFIETTSIISAKAGGVTSDAWWNDLRKKMSQEQIEKKYDDVFLDCELNDEQYRKLTEEMKKQRGPDSDQ
ncbi:hypothetical protein LLG95_18040 [bacterium]|nr:hypothetical protein [bacterium]